MIISLSGAQGSGKSTVAQKLSEKLNWPRYYMGGLRREAAAKRGLTLAEYNLLGESNPKTDQEVDEYQKKLGLENDNFIIEGRTSWYFIPHSFKIYLDVSEDIGASRIFKQLKSKNQRNEDKEIASLEEMKASLRQRMASDTRRYKQYYGVDVNDKSHYDYCLDTSELSEEEVFNIIYDLILKSIDNPKK